MWHGRRWASVAPCIAVAIILSLGMFVRAQAGDAGAEALGWRVSGSLEAGGMWSAGEHSSSKFEEYRDMDNGFLGELYLKGEKKDSPYHFDLWAKNPVRDDQAYEGAFGRYGTFLFDAGWTRVRHVLSNTAQTIFQESGGDFTLPSTLRPAIATIFNGGSRADIEATILGLGRHVDLAFNTDVGFVGFNLTPTEALRFDLAYTNRQIDGARAESATMAGSRITELAVPLDQTTHEAKFLAEYAKPSYAFQLGYTGSFFDNGFQSYKWDNPVTTPGTGTQDRGEIGAAPDNMAHTFSLTGRASLPWWRTNISAAGSYTMLRQDETFVNNVAAPGAGVTVTNADDEGKTSADAKANRISGNVLLTSRPIRNVTATARYRYYEYQNDTPIHSFTDKVAQDGDVVLGTFTTTQARFTKQNAGMDISYRPIRPLSLKAGYEYEHWNRGDFDGKSFGTDEHIGKAAMDLMPTDWFLGRVTYTYGNRNLKGYGKDPLAGNGPGFLKFNYADRVRNRVDTLLQFSRWETFTPSLNFGYAYDNFQNSAFGLTDDRNISAGASLGWTPVSWLTLSADYTYERHDATQRVFDGGTPFQSKSKDEFHIANVGAILDIVPKTLDLNFGYGVTFGYTTIDNTNLTSTCVGQTCAFRYDKIQNVLQVAKVVARYRMTEKLSIRGAFAYERFNERNFALDPMLAYMGFYDTSAAASQSVWLGATVPNYEAYILSGFVRYQF